MSLKDYSHLERISLNLYIVMFVDRCLRKINWCFRFQVEGSEWRFILTGGVGVAEGSGQNPDKTWISEKTWTEICRLSLITVFKGFSDSFKENILDWRLIFDSTEPHRQIIPLKWQSELNSFQKLMVLRCLRPDKLTNQSLL